MNYTINKNIAYSVIAAVAVAGVAFPVSADTVTYSAQSAKTTPAKRANTPKTKANQASIQGSVYAEVHGLPDMNCIRVYKGAVDHESVHGTAKSLWCRKVKPRVEFFDIDGEWLLTEPIAINQNQTNNIQSFVDSIRSRLTDLPIASTVEVEWITEPSHQNIVVRDAYGHVIVETGFSTWSQVLQENGALPQAAIDRLAPKIANSSILKGLRIRKRLDVTKGRDTLLTKIKTEIK
jgi:hypothetical protein